MAGDWYYAQGDQRLGPVSLAELRSFLQSGRINKATLVWTDGMQDWTAAAEVGAVSGPESAENLRVPMRPPTPSSTPNAATPPRPPSDPPSSPVTERRPPDLHDGGGDFSRFMRQGAWPLLALGLTLVVVSRGCDMLAQRHAAYLDARTNYLQQYYADESLRLTKYYEDRRKDVLDTKSLDPADKDKRIEEINKEEKAELEKTEKARVDTTRDHNATKREFVPSEKSWSYWRGAVYVLGLSIVVVALVGSFVASEGTDRWVSLALLGILLYAMFATSVPWH